MGGTLLATVYVAQLKFTLETPAIELSLLLSANERVMAIATETFLRRELILPQEKERNSKTKRRGIYDSAALSCLSRLSAAIARSDMRRARNKNWTATH
jgi:hypothetical protein